MGVVGGNQTNFAKRIGTSKGTVTRWKKEGRLPDLDELVRIATEGQVTIDWILWGREKPQILRLSPLAQRVQRDLAEVNDDETAVLFPLVRALLELRRSSDESFEHVLKSIRASASHERLDLAPIATALSEFHRRAVRRPKAKTAGEPRPAEHPGASTPGTPLALSRRVRSRSPKGPR